MNIRQGASVEESDENMAFPISRPETVGHLPQRTDTSTTAYSQNVHFRKLQA